MTTIAPPPHGQVPPTGPPVMQPPRHGPGPPDVPPPVGRMRWYRRGWVIAIAALLVGIGLGAASGSSKTAPRAATVTAPAQTVVQTVPGPTKTVVHVRKVPGPTTTVTQAVAAAAPAPSPASGGSGGGGPAGTQHFSGTNQQNLGTISVPTDSTLSWSCPGCSDTNFIINNADGDSGFIPTNGFEQVQGVDPISAGEYHTVVVDTTGGSWTIEITPG